MLGAFSGIVVVTPAVAVKVCFNFSSFNLVPYKLIVLNELVKALYSFVDSI